MRLPRALAICACSTPSLAAAQVVQGVVTERGANQPLTGVLVSATELGEREVRKGALYTLTNASGEFRIVVGRAGRYQVEAKRIGVARYLSTTFDLDSGETQRLAIVLEPFRWTLPEVTVTATNLCLNKPDQLRTIVALWDEARTALRAAEVTGNEQLLSGWLSRYARTLEPRTLRILKSRFTASEGRFDRPIRSVSGDSLARGGFWLLQDADTVIFRAPDAEALLSDAFLAAHCFEYVQGRGARRGLAGIAFRPRTVRVTGDIEGTLWLDAGSFELRFLEFRYTNLITVPRNPHIGGEVHFQRHPSGAWMVRRWFVRMPVFPEVLPAAVARDGRVTARRRASVHRLIEEGGGLFTPGLRTWENSGTILGSATDSTGRVPLRGAMVALSGTSYSTAAGPDGSFRFDSVPPGAYTLLVSERGYADLGQLATDEPVTLTAGQTYRARLRATPTRELRDALCYPAPAEQRTATLHVSATHLDTCELLPRMGFWLRWPDPDQSIPVDSVTRWVLEGILKPGAWRLQGIEAVTDELGSMTFCGVPADTRVELLLLKPADDPSLPEAMRFTRVGSFTLRAGEVTHHPISVRPPN